MEGAPETITDRHRQDSGTREGGKGFKEMVVGYSKITKGSKGDSYREATISLKEGSTYEMLTQFS